MATSAKRKKASKRPTTRAGRAAKKVAPELIAAVSRASKVKGPAREGFSKSAADHDPRVHGRERSHAERAQSVRKEAQAAESRLGQVNRADHAPGLLAAVVDQLNVTHSRIHDLTTRIESLADAHCGGDGKVSGGSRAEGVGSPSGRAYELLGAASSIHRALDALTEQVDRLNLL